MSLPTKRESPHVVLLQIPSLLKFTYAGFLIFIASASELKKVVTTVKLCHGAVHFRFVLKYCNFMYSE